MRALVHGTTGGIFLSAPKSLAKGRFKHLSYYSAAFAAMADLITLSLGATLKRKESISAKLGDILSYLFLASACLKRFRDDGQPEADLPIIDYLCDSLFYDIEQRMDELCCNIPNGFLAWILRRACLCWGLRQKKPSDKLVQDVARLMLYPNESFERMTSGIYKTKSKDNFIANLEEALRLVVANEELEKRVRQAHKQNLIHGLSEEDLINDAHVKNLINNDERERLVTIARMRSELIAVDAF